MILIQSNPEIRELDLDTFRLALRNLEDSEEGVPFLHTHNHNTAVTVGGVTLARVIEITNGYTMTFEDGQYAVNLVGANSNVPDVTNVNQVSVRSANSAGLIVVVSGSGVTQQDKEEIIGGVWDEPIEQHLESGTVGEALDQVEVDGAAIAEVVWDEPLAGHTSEGTAGAKLKEEIPVEVDPSSIAAAVWDRDITPHSDLNTAQEVLRTTYEKLKDLIEGKTEVTKPKAKFKV